MGPLTRYGREATSVFDLLGRNEVDLTAALGWCLVKAPSLLQLLLKHLDIPASTDDVDIALEVADALGRTDIELSAPQAKIVIEAKQGWLVPGEQQLGLYAGRFTGIERGLLVSMSDSSQQWARTQLPTSVGTIPVRHLPWDDVRTRLRTAINSRNGRERLWLQELESYLGTVTSTRPLDDQWVFCVVVSDTRFGDLTFKEYVTQERVYFHPYGGHNRWPRRPPNFMAFRWGGFVRQVNRVRSFEVLPSLTQRWPAISPEEAEGAHIVYDLGTDIPIPNVRTTGTYASGRVWCLLDQLLTQPTLRDAVYSSDELTTS